MATAIGQYATLASAEARIGGTFTSAEETLLSALCDQVNQMIERRTQRVLAPVASTTYLFDGDGTNRLYVARASNGTPTGGLLSVSLVEVAYYTSAAFQTLPAGQYFLREQGYPSGPFDALMFTNFPRYLYVYWPKGFDTVRVTAVAGPAVVPDDIIDLALNCAVSAWNQRQGGESSADAGSPDWASRFLSPRDKQTLRDYTLADGLA